MRRAVRLISARRRRASGMSYGPMVAGGKPGGADRREHGGARRRQAGLGYNRDVARTRRPKLGQHFLSSPRYRQRIVELLPLRADDLVLEIGPGRGAMTELLARRARRVVAVELDAVLAAQLEENLKADANIEIIQGDILATDLAALCRRSAVGKCFVVGNLPYAITSPILHHLLHQADSIRAMTLLVQREVAERLSAAPGSRDYGSLTVFAQLYAEPRIALNVPPGAFSPPPKVQSALVDFTMRSKFPSWSLQQRAEFLAFVKACFAQKRKTLLNNLGRTFPRGVIETACNALGISSRRRAEELDLEQFADLFSRVQSFRGRRAER